MLRDRIVCGIEDQKIQCRLLAEYELMFDKANEFAIASESANKNAKDLLRFLRILSISSK